ncbi:hypothetical protein B0O80DRAFT_510127 [Mortierella sp. GBAus27b]|nr:hypothetical protein BGX31_004236 [Mortierella sp. GBA43]KAI8362137.1 hypothetical protein B0O80DRAFT_510127 [Mortierella sp. GBAus27b]
MASSAPPHLLQRMAEKRQELEQLSALRQLASHLQTHFDELSEKLDGLMQGNQGTSDQQCTQAECNDDPIEFMSTYFITCLAASKVLENWGDVFRTIELTDNYAAQTDDQPQSSLVRIPTS